jgi:hypothetical protein
MTKTQTLDTQHSRQHNHQTTAPSSDNSLRLEGQYSAYIENLECKLHLRLNAIGCLAGTFYTQGETLEIYGGMPSMYGDAYGIMRESSHLETLAVFHAIPQPDGVMLELDLPGVGDLMKLSNAQTIMFKRSSE